MTEIDVGTEPPPPALDPDPEPPSTAAEAAAQAARETALFDELIDRASKAREAASRSLHELVWRFEDGTVGHPELTSSRWAHYLRLVDYLSQRPEGSEPLTESEEEQFYLDTRGVTAGILLYLCLHPATVWMAPRPGNVPLMCDPAAFFAAAVEWVDAQIPPARVDEAVSTARLLTDLTWSALPVVVSDAEEDDGTAEKKTLLPAGKTDI